MHSGRAQNLVPNGDFEKYNNCPKNLAEIDFSPSFLSFPTVQGWVCPTFGTSDYYNACAAGTMAGVPLNVAGYRTAHSGSAYAGMVGFGSLPGTYREMITTSRRKG